MKDLIISAPNQGIGPSPITGYGNVVNLDIYTIPGVARLNNLLAKKSASTVTNTIQWMRKNPLISTEVYAVDAGGAVYKSTDSGDTWSAITGNTHTFTVTIASPAVFSATAHGFSIGDQVIFSTTGALPTGLTEGTTYYIITAGFTANAFEVALTSGGTVINTSGSQSGTHSFLTNGGGLEIWKDYLFVPRASSLDVYGPLSVSPSWTNNWKKIDTDSLWHPMIVSDSDNKLYGGAGKYIFSLDENTAPFVPATAGSYTYTQQALDLPPNYRIKCLAELGDNLMIGTWMGTNIYDFKIANIFPWDRASVSFGAPLKMNENGVNSMLNIGNSLYIQAGIDGKLFLSNGVEATLIAQIPSSIADIEGGLYLEPLPGAIISYKGRPFFGVSSGGSGATAAGMGVWSLQRTAQGNILNYENQISTLSDGSSSTVKIGALLGISRDTMLVGWKDASTYGIDKTTNTSRYTSYSGYFESPFYNVGTPLVKRMFTKGEFQLTKAMTTGQGVRIKFRTDLSSSFTTIGTYDFATLAGVLSHNFVADIPACEFVQIRCELTTGSSSNTSPQIKQITLR